MSPSVLQKITTEYIETEDRIRLSGEYGNAEPMVIWLTQRLLQRLLPRLIQLLEGQSSGTREVEVRQGFAQQLAQAKLVPQQPIKPQLGSASWLASSVDLSLAEHRISLIFRGIEGQSAVLMLEATPLRQWLSILYDAYVKAEWGREIWPVWFRQGMQEASQEMIVLH